MLLPWRRLGLRASGREPESTEICIVISNFCKYRESTFTDKHQASHRQLSHLRFLMPATITSFDGKRHRGTDRSPGRSAWDHAHGPTVTRSSPRPPPVVSRCKPERTRSQLTRFARTKASCKGRPRSHRIGLTPDLNVKQMGPRHSSKTLTVLLSSLDTSFGSICLFISKGSCASE